ncbi:MAG: hypothetical protein NTX44_13465 [Ignavibacteriales bacterium]|nr:hypothetical protein [Ignavibacteriales bacterium]
MAEQIYMPKALRTHLENNMLGEKISNLRLKRLLGSGNTAVTYEAEDKYDINWALKIVTRESYGERAPFREIGRFAQVEDERYLVFPKEVGETTLKLRGKEHEFIWFKSRCVRGKTLHGFLKDNSNFSARVEILRYMENLTAALEELQRLGFDHGDLHDRNIMREVIGEGGPIPEVRYVIIDFSEAHHSEAVEEGLSPDLANFGRHLRSFYDSIYRRDIVSREDEKLLSAISHIPGLLEGDSLQTHGFTKASIILDNFKDALKSAEDTPRKLLDPFYPLSAEYIANDALLADLCYTNMWWTNELQKNNNVLLIGPRGCGKTMIFRRLRLKTKILASKQNEILSDNYIGFYIPCESLFYMRFSDLSEVNIEDYKEALILYFNMAILHEVSSTIGIIPKSLGPISGNLAHSIGTLLKDEIGSLDDAYKSLDSFTVLAEIANCAEHIMRQIRKSIAFGNHILPKGSGDFILRLVQIVKHEVPSLSSRHFVFFLDDYTEERVPISLQKALHPIVCQRSPELSFKISAHMFGSIYSFPQPLVLDEGRNIIVSNLGSVYLSLNRKRRESKLLLEILNGRFKNSEGYGGTIEKWLGKTSYPGGRTLSHALHDKMTRPKVLYHGIECLMNLCTGDYSEMIRMVGEIFREANIHPSSPVQRIPSHIQDRAIVRVSREYLGRIRHIRPDGQKLFDVVNSFGKLSQKLLYDRNLVGQGKLKSGKARKDPYDLLIVYVDNLTKASRSARTIWERLQKASVFVDIGLAPSQRSVVADRATLRRIYCPAFRTTLTSSEHLQTTKDQFEWLMDKPEEFCNDYYRKEINASDQTSFWSDEQPSTIQEDEFTISASLPEERNKVDFEAFVPKSSLQAVETLPDITHIADSIHENDHFDILIGAIGFEDRTTEALKQLVARNVTVDHSLLFEFDIYYEANEKRRQEYEDLLKQLASGKPHRPINAPVGVPDPVFSERFRSLLKTLSKGKSPKIVFDCTSCPSLILSKTLSVLFGFQCDLTILYTEAAEYFPSRDEWESGKLVPPSKRVQGPFAGVRFVAKPTELQSDDIGEHPVLLILFPTFNTERTDGVLAELEPDARMWFFGEPHELSSNSYRIDMAKSFASPIIHPGDKWSLVSTFDYKKAFLNLSGIYSQYRFTHRIVVMPHGSKMQTLGVSIFATIHQVSMVFAMPKSYNTERYSKGYIDVWCIRFGDVKLMNERLKTARFIQRLGANGG